MLRTKPRKERALLTIACAGSVFMMPAIAYNENISESTNSIVQRFVDDNLMDPQNKAYELLLLANDYLSGKTTTELEAKYNDSFEQWQRFQYRSIRDWEGHLATQAHVLSKNPCAIDKGKNTETVTLPQNKSLADSAIQAALLQLDKSSDRYSRLMLYFIAKVLYFRTQNAAGIRHCDEVLEKAFQSCESQPIVDEEQIKACAAVLNAMARNLDDIDVPDLAPRPADPIDIVPVGLAKYRESESLKLRAIVMVDRLDSASHIRRKCHRDLALWYMRLGRNELAEIEKQKLFQLVGVKDDRIPYAQFGMCGHLVWWQVNVRIGGFCGMG